MQVLNLDDTPDNRQKAKQIIAEDLNLPIEKVAFIPQYDYHIDLNYRPLHNGDIAVPDYEESIKLLKVLNIPELENDTIDTYDELTDKSYPNKKTMLIAKLEYINEKTKNIRQGAEQILSEKGYNLVKIPAFVDDINYLNGIAGTASDDSEHAGESYYITNESPYPELNEAIKKYFYDAKIDNIDFVPTQNYLLNDGGIDCLTLEQPD